MKRKVHRLKTDFGDLPRGAVVQVIEEYHVNRQSKAELYAEIYTAERDVQEGKAVFIYTALGYFIIPKAQLEEV